MFTRTKSRAISQRLAALLAGFTPALCLCPCRLYDHAAQPHGNLSVDGNPGTHGDHGAGSNSGSYHGWIAPPFSGYRQDGHRPPDRNGRSRTCEC